jgi:predicted phage tail protein
LTEEEFAANSTLIGSVDYEAMRAARGTLSYTDSLALAGEPTRLRYAVRYVNASGQRASFSNFLLIEPAARIARPPSNVVAKPSESAIEVGWQPPESNIDGSAPVNVLGYNVYRLSTADAEAEPVLLNPTVITETSYADKSFRFGVAYAYFVRAVSLGTGGGRVESLDSNVATITPVDVYPPSAPISITIAAAPGRLSLFFPANTESDIAGYNLYRSLDKDLPKEQWVKLNGELLTRTTYQDDKVESGKTYYYYLTAVDTTGNVSPPSDVVSETVP